MRSIHSASDLIIEGGNMCVLVCYFVQVKSLFADLKVPHKVFELDNMSKYESVNDDHCHASMNTF